MTHLELHFENRVVAFPAERFFIGSDPDCAVRIEGHALEPRHAEITCESDGSWWVHDVSKSGSVRIDGNPVTDSRLAAGSHLSLGQLELSIHQGQAPTQSLRRAAATPAPPRTLIPGDLIENRYRIIGRIAQGGMGEVYEAVHVELNKPVALKVMLPDLSDDADFAGRFKREAFAASRIGQLNIVDVSDFGRTTDGRFFFAMELLDGRTVAAHLRDGPFEPARACRVAIQIARALAAAHDRGIVHRDLKPENVMLLQHPGHPDFVKVLDFGIAKVNDAHGPTHATQHGLVVGTPQYMSPEQSAGLAVDLRSDIYSLGLILYELLSGRPPFKAETSAQLMSMHMTAQPPPLGVDVPADLLALVSALLAKRPEGRPHTMHEVISALQPFALETGPNPAAVSPATPKGATQVDARLPHGAPRSKKIVRLFAGSFVLAIVLGVAAAAIIDRREEPRLPAPGPPQPKPAPKPRTSADGFTCTGVSLFGGDPLDDQSQLRPTEGTGLLEHPPLRYRTVRFWKGYLITHDAEGIWAASLTDRRLRRVAGREEQKQALITGPCATARFANLFGLVVASDGSLFVSDQTANAILKVTDPLGPGCNVEHWAGTPRDVPRGKLTPDNVPSLGDRDGPGLDAQFRLPERLAIDSKDRLYVWDSGGSAVRQIDTDLGHHVGTLAKGIGDGAAMVSLTVIGEVVYVWGQDGTQPFLVSVDLSGTVTHLLGGRADLFEGVPRDTLRLGGITADGDTLVLINDGRVYRVSTQGEVSPPLAGGARSGPVFSEGYDPRAPHTAEAMELITSASGDGYLVADAEHDLYVSGMLENGFVLKIDCGPSAQAP